MKARKKILIVEDNQLNREILCAILEKQYTVLQAGNGKEALDILEKQKDAISLILLDIVMPVMDGYTFLEKMRDVPEYSSIPVIVVSQSYDEADESTALSHGASDFVVKPYNAQVIRHRVESIINLNESAAMMNLLRYDRLTGMYSKEYFYQSARDILLDNPDRQYDIICSDFENFKLVNEAYGMKTGDRLLRGTAELLGKDMRGKGICSHFNSDLFVCMLDHKESYSNDLFKQITDNINQLTSAKNIVVKWGIYVAKDRKVSIEQMCDWALETARSIKGQYGKYFAYYDDELRNRMIHEQEITACMEQALAEGQFHVWLQPKYRLDGAPLTDAEALVRWFHPDWGMQPPSVFIPLFEQNGFITKLDQYVWEEACRMIRNWDEAGLGAVNISVNVSRADVYNIDICSTMVGLIEKYGIEPKCLHLEITESVVTENPDLIIQTVKDLRGLGFVIEMDDFGSGSSSLNMLSRMPLDILKLDMQFIKSEMAKPAKDGILRYIIGLAHSLKFEVVAEGVETKRQMERLDAMDCDYVQGYYLAKPMEPKEMEKLLAAHSVAKNVSESSQADEKEAPEEILFLIDEDELIRREIPDIFRGSFQVEEAANEDEALTGVGLFGNRISVILLSLSLAKKNEGRLWETLQTENKVWNVPIILLGDADADAEEEALSMGADDFQTMPCRNRSLQLRVEHVRGRKAGTRKRRRT